MTRASVRIVALCLVVAIASVVAVIRYPLSALAVPFVIAALPWAIAKITPEAP